MGRIRLLSQNKCAPRIEHSQVFCLGKRVACHVVEYAYGNKENAYRNGVRRGLDSIENLKVCLHSCLLEFNF